MQRELTDPFRYPKPKLKPDPTVVKKGKKPKNMGKTLYRLWSYLAQKRDYYFLF